MFEIGSPVVCICTPPIVDPFLPDDPWYPVDGGVYYVSDLGTGLEGPWLDLIEDPFPNEDAAWPAAYFRPLRKAESQAREQWQQFLRNPTKVDA